MDRAALGGELPPTQSLRRRCARGSVPGGVGRTSHRVSSRSGCTVAHVRVRIAPSTSVAFGAAARLVGADRLVVAVESERASSATRALRRSIWGRVLAIEIVPPRWHASPSGRRERDDLRARCRASLAACGWGHRPHATASTDARLIGSSAERRPPLRPLAPNANGWSRSTTATGEEGRGYLVAGGGMPSTARRARREFATSTSSSRSRAGKVIRSCSGNVSAHTERPLVDVRPGDWRHCP